MSKSRPCVKCRQETVFRSPRDKYCAPCGAIADGERKKAWAARQPKTYKPLSEAQLNERRMRETVRRERALLINEENVVQGITWDAHVPPDMHHLVRVSIPFDYNLSKNAMWSMAKGANYIFASRKHKVIRADIVHALRRSLSQKTFFMGKVWIDVLVQKPNHRGDAINMLDGICDAVKEAIGVDDNWFCLRKLDWQIVKNNPRIFIGVGQEVSEHHLVCSYCGQILPLDKFGKRTHGPLGRARVCLTCTRIDDGIKREKRMELP